MIRLRDYQREISAQAARLLEERKICYLSMECRTGKTITAFEAARIYGAKRVLIVSKLKALKGIADDYNAMSAQFNPLFSLEMINYESAHKIAGAFDLVILDEAHTLGAFPRPSKRAQELKRVCTGLPIIYLSGTPSPESFAQLFHQFWVSSFSPFQHRNFYAWAKDGFVNVRQKQINGYMINDYSDANEAKIKAIAGDLFLSYSQQDAGFFTLSDEYVLRVRMKQDTAQLFQMLKRDRVARIGDFTILGDTPAKLLTKLHQISGGTIITESGERAILDASKAEYIKRAFNGRKIAIFYVYQSEADLLYKVFPNHTEDAHTFQRSGNDCVFIAQVRKAREGVRLDTADALIFYNVEYSYLSYEQGKNRILSKERETPAPVYFICSDCGIESAILDAVHHKKDFTLSYYRRYGKESRPA